MTPDLLAINSAVSPGELDALSRLATGKRVLEIGSYRGRSTIAMALTALQVVAVDWHRGDPHNGIGEDSLPEFLRNLNRFNVRGKVIPIIGRTQEVGSILASGSFDFAFVDGYHGFEETLTYIDLTNSLVKPGGLVAYHDYFDRDSFRVKSAVDSRFDCLFECVETLVVVRVS